MPVTQLESQSRQSPSKVYWPFAQMPALPGWGHDIGQMVQSSAPGPAQVSQAESQGMHVASPETLSGTLALAYSPLAQVLSSQPGGGDAGGGAGGGHDFSLTPFMPAKSQLRPDVSYGHWPLSCSG